MKKLSKILGLITCTFVLALSCVLLTACGGNDPSPYSVAGVTLKGTDNCSIVWDSDATQQDKQDLWDAFEVTNESEFLQKYSQESGSFYKAFNFAFKNDGTVVLAKTGQEQQTLYYSQTNDLKTIRIYKDEGHTNGYCILSYNNGEYCMAEVTDYNSTIYFKFQKV